MKSHWAKAVCLLGCQLVMSFLYSSCRLTLSLTLWLTLAIDFIDNVTSSETRRALTHWACPFVL